MILKDNNWALSFAAAGFAGGWCYRVCQQHLESLPIVGKLYWRKCGIGDFVSCCMVGKP